MALLSDIATMKPNKIRKVWIDDDKGRYTARSTQFQGKIQVGDIVEHCRQTHGSDIVTRELGTCIAVQNNHRIPGCDIVTVVMSNGEMIEFYGAEGARSWLKSVT